MIRNKKLFALFIILFGISGFIVLIYSIFRDEWYNYNVKEVSKYIDCSQKDVLDLYNEVISELDDELKDYELVEVSFKLDGEVQQIEFSFYKPGILVDVKSKSIIILPQINCIKSIVVYEGNLKAYGGMIYPMNIESLSQINQDSFSTEGTSRVVYSENGVRVY